MNWIIIIQRKIKNIHGQLIRVEWKILLAIEGNRKEEEIEFFNIHIQSDFQYYAETRNQQQNVTAQHRKPIDPMKAEYPNRPHTVLAN